MARPIKADGLFAGRAAGNAQAWYYPADRVLVLWECYLYERARKKFSKFDYISIVQGDSGEVLSVILADIKQPCLFWLDGHYSGGDTAKGRLETPILQELHCVLTHSIEGHVILIDDARLFTGQNNYPTVGEIQELVFKRHPDWRFEVKHDIIRIHGRAQ